MAGAILSPVFETIFGNLASAAIQQLQTVWGVDVEKELQNLKSTLSAIQNVLEDAEERQFDSKAVRDWLWKLKDVAYGADDLVDEIVTDAQQTKTTESGTEAAAGKKRKWVWNYFSSLLNSSRWDMACRIREINVRLDKIAKEREVLHLETRDGSKQLDMIRDRRRPPASSVRDESSDVLGRVNDIEQIIKFLLCGDSSKGKYSVIAIVGMGGVGKTTLAQVVYNDKRVTDNFELRAWVCVSEHFSVERLTKEIIASASKNSCDLSDIDSLQCCLRDKLKGKKFLLVLDDIWSENDSDWEQLQTPFTFGAKGSRIVVTTRSQAVSDAMQATCSRNLKCLSKHDCWSLFVSQAFKDENINAYPNLIKVGEELVNKCRGLPLAAKALGGLLSSKRQLREWEKILKSPIWDLRGPASKILPALALSYQHLPAHLKQCFTFCSIFPKDYDFRQEKLVQLWVAHGFIRPEEGKKIEDTGSDYFNDLLLRSFFQPSSFIEINYKMHDLYHDLAQFISGDECFQMVHDNSHSTLRKTRHLSYIVGARELINFEPFYESKGLRTFLLIQNFRDISEKVPCDMFERLRFLRVLDLSSIKITELPNSIGNLKHLRYLNLSSTKIKELPKSISSIHNMQTLLLSNCCNLVVLPNEMRKLINLRHLDLRWCYNVLSMPPQIGRLTSLQTLPRFVVSRERERGIAELKKLTHICGDLSIEKLENVAETEDARQANLKNKPFIDRLYLVWSKDRDQSLKNAGVEEEVAEGLQPHPTLKTLEFSGYLGIHFPSWMTKMDMLLSNLTTLRLHHCKRCSILPPLGRLPSLCCLEINGLEEVKQMGCELSDVAGGFPSLKNLRLEGMLNLEHWHESQEGHFPCLENLHILNCPQLRQIPYSPLAKLACLGIRGCASLVSLPPLSSLKKLRLDYLANLEEWCDVWEANFPHLQQLTIHNCPKVKPWPSTLPVITELDVFHCEGFDDLPFLPSLCKLDLGGHSERLLKSVSCLTSLSSLTINNIPRLTSMPQGMLPALTQLKDLRIYNCYELVTLQDEDLPSTLTHLIFLGCLGLKSLPRGLHALTSLQELRIDDCPNVMTLPEEKLPAALQRLEILRCPTLKERCLKDIGEDWPKISHIPHVWLI